MFNFRYYTPTEVVFGKGTESQTGELVKKYHGTKVLLHYGGGSVVRSGLLDRIKASLDEAGVAYVSLGGVVPNPHLELVYEGIELCKKEGVDFLLAVGGGSVIDSCKAIAYGLGEPDKDVWELYEHTRTAKACLPVASVLTIAAAGSEMSNSSVLTNTETGKKMGLPTDLNKPKFAILNPELTFTLPKYQIACGITDIMMHTMERYFIPNQKNQMTDEIAEALLRVVIENGRTAMENPCDYDAMSEIMWCSTLSHNGITGLGRVRDFSVHKFGQAIGGKYDYAHGATLSAVWEAWAKYLYMYDVDRFAHFAEKIWSVECEDKKLAAEEGIRKTVEFFREIGMPVNMRELGISEITDEKLMELAMDATMDNTVKLAKVKELDVNEVYQIFKNAR